MPIEKKGLLQRLRKNRKIIEKQPPRTGLVGERGSRSIALEREREMRERCPDTPAQKARHALPIETPDAVVQGCHAVTVVVAQKQLVRSFAGQHDLHIPSGKTRHKI